MRKIPTLFVRDEQNRAHVTREVTPGCEWVIEGWGIPTRKYDGTCVLRDAGGWYARREVKSGKNPPTEFMPIETDETTGKTVGWEPITNSGFVKFWEEATAGEDYDYGTYELCGPKINGNPENFSMHVLIPHGCDLLFDVPRDFDGFREWLLARHYEGIVFHGPNGEMAKIKRRDFESKGDTPCIGSSG